MTAKDFIRYYIPFMGMRDIPDEVAVAVELDGAPDVKYKGFTLSWLGINLVLSAVERDE